MILYWIMGTRERRTLALCAREVATFIGSYTYLSVLVQVPTFSNPTSTTSPSTSQSGSALPKFTPFGLFFLQKHYIKSSFKKTKSHSRSSKDDITRQQRRSHREKAHKMLHSKNHIRRTRILLRNPINLGPNIQRLRVRYLPRRNNSRTPRCPPIRALPHRELGLRKSTTVDLPSTVGDIVTDCIP